MTARAIFSPILALFLTPALALAASFPDVPASYPFAQAVNALAERGVIGGNPDGTFRPHDPVNRAALLKMLYRAAGRNATSETQCFKDVVSGSWYEPYVCDAKAQGYVQGYADGRFKPEQAVTRAEAIKLTLSVLRIPAADAGATVYTDVHAEDWFSPFIYTALARNILPIAGQDGSLFSPSALLERGEAAAYIWNALNEGGASSSSVSSSVASSSRSSASSVSVAPPSAPPTVQVSVPFTDTQPSGVVPPAYLFSVNGTLTVDVTATLSAGSTGAVSCRLYKIGDNGFSDEYYLGIEDGKQCFIRAALGTGSWQLQVVTAIKQSGYTVETKKLTGDNNDGFTQAQPFLNGKPRVELLDANDLEDWYTFSVSPTDQKVLNNGGKDMTVKLISTANLGCLVYPLGNVDLFGFQGPKCNEQYRYPAGTYMVSVRHLPPRGAKATYSIELR